MNGEEKVWGNATEHLLVGFANAILASEQFCY